jgi:DUF177 domain-containing protein
VDLRSVTGPELPLDRVFRAEELGPETARTDDYRLAGDVRFTGRLQKNDPRYRLTGRVTATLELNCGRCLEAFTLPVDAEVDLTYLPDPHDAAAEEVELEEEDLTTAYYHGHLLDLGEMLREQFYLALPMRPLCREDCQGLCPQCGTNLNQGTCACDARWEDPRLAGLRAIMKKSEGSRS